MPPTRGRLEGRITVPSGGWTGTVDDSGGGGVATFMVPAGTYYLSTGGTMPSLIGKLSAALNAAASNDALTVTLSAGEAGTGKVTITSSGTTSITWTSTDLRDILGFTGDLAAAKTWTGTNQARGLWLPNCPYKAPNAVSATWRGWREADFRAVENAAGFVFAHMGQEKEVSELSWHAVERARVWEGNATTPNASWERFARDCIWGVSSWGTAGGPIRFYPDAANSSVFVTYKVVDVAAIRPEPLHADWVGGPWRVVLPRLVVLPVDEVAPEPVRIFPSTLTGWTTTFPSVPAPAHLWTMQDAGPGVVDSIGGVNLATSNSSGAESYRRAGDPLARYSVYLESAASNLRAASTSLVDQTTGDFSVLFRFRAPVAGSNGQHFARKKSSSSGTNGWSVVWANSGNIQALIDTPAAAVTPVTVTANLADGTYHDVLAVWDRTNGTMSLYTDIGNASASIAAHAGSSVSNGTYFGLGDTNENLNSAARVEYSYFAFFTSALTISHFETILTAI